MTSKQKDGGTVVMVDVYAPTMRLARAFMEAGYHCVRVQSTTEVPPVYSSGFSTKEFADDIVHKGDLQATLDAVAGHHPVAALTGGELGVELADRLSEELGLPGNGSRLSAQRRNKYLQVEHVGRCGLRVTRQMLVMDPGTLRDWHRELDSPVVIKPVRSAGNDGVAFCDTPEESVDAYCSVGEQTNIFGIPNEGVVAQEFIEGTEFAVNTVSCRGTHRVTDIWRYVKIAANGVKNRVAGGLYVDPGDPARDRLEAYAFSVLDALEVRYGPAHLEVILTTDGPCLVEVGVRLCGADAARYALIAGGESQVEWTVDAYTAPDRFLSGNDRPAETRQHVAMAWLTSPVEGTLASYPLIDQVKALASFHDLQMVVSPGQPIVRTVSDTTEPMAIGLAHHSREVVERDFNTVLYLDGPGFYELRVR